jgi:hypothetical protein
LLLLLLLLRRIGLGFGLRLEREREKGSRNFYSWMVQWLETDVKMAHFT